MLWGLIALALILGLLSLRGEADREAYVRARLQLPEDLRCPPATVIVPVKGADEGLAENLRSLARIDYPDFELIVVARSSADLPEGCVPAGARTVLAGDGDTNTGEKINNLLAAVTAARPESQVLAFADSDGRVPRTWLKALVAALAEPGAGAATGYRWHLPEPMDCWSGLRSVWNAVIAGGFGPSNRFVWGGATAILRERFRDLRVADYWRGAISDDYRLAEAVLDHGLRIVFAPRALVASVDHTGAAEFCGWIRRQMMITRFYAPSLWWLALIAHIVYCVAMAGAAWLAWHGDRWALAALGAQLGIGMWKGRNRLRLARLAMPEHERWFARHGWTHIGLVPLGTWLWLYACLASAFSRTIEWRGYRLRLRRIPKPFEKPVAAKVNDGNRAGNP